MERIAIKPLTVGPGAFFDELSINSPAQMRIQALPHLGDYLEEVPSFANPLMQNKYIHPGEGFFCH